MCLLNSTQIKANQTLKNMALISTTPNLYGTMSLSWKSLQKIWMSRVFGDWQNQRQTLVGGNYLSRRER